MSEYITTALQEEEIKTAQEKLAELIRSDFARIDRMKADEEVTDFSKLDTITIGVMPGDGIGPLIMTQALRVLNQLLAPEIASGKVKIRIIEGMTFERRVELGESLPADVLAACKECNVLIKGPFTTPRAGDKFPDGTPMPNMVSANSLLRRSLDLFAAVRPIKIPEKNIDWCFFRENIEGEYIWGNKGIQVNDDLAIDFKVQTKQGSERIARAAFEYARKNGKHNVTAITKANIVKLADGCPPHRRDRIPRHRGAGASGGCHDRQDGRPRVHQGLRSLCPAEPLWRHRDRRCC